MKKSLAILFLTVAAMVVLGIPSPVRCATQPPATPSASPDSSSAKPSIPEIHSLKSLQGIFNLGQGAVRVVAIVSPTDLQCLAGLGQLGQMFSRHSSNRLRMYVIYTPGLAKDSETAAARAAARFKEGRVMQVWDPDTTVASAFGPVLGLKAADTWGTFLLYDTQATLGDSPAQPVVWMRMGSDAGTHAFDASALETETNRLLGVLQRKLDAQRRGQQSTDQ